MLNRYFRLSLTDFLRESHPERLKDRRFILACTDAATGTYEQAVRSGDTPAEAIEQANAVLFSGLHFSKHDTLKNILWNEFPNEVSEDEAGKLASKLLPECEPVFAGYPLSDGFTIANDWSIYRRQMKCWITSASCCMNTGPMKRYRETGEKRY